MRSPTGFFSLAPSPLVSLGPAAGGSYPFSFYLLCQAEVGAGMGEDLSAREAERKLLSLSLQWSQETLRDVTWTILEDFGRHDSINRRPTFNSKSQALNISGLQVARCLWLFW